MAMVAAPRTSEADVRSPSTATQVPPEEKRGDPRTTFATSEIMNRQLGMIDRVQGKSPFPMLAADGELWCKGTGDCRIVYNKQSLLFGQFHTQANQKAEEFFAKLAKHFNELASQSGIEGALECAPFDMGLDSRAGIPITNEPSGGAVNKGVVNNEFQKPPSVIIPGALINHTEFPQLMLAALASVAETEPRESAILQKVLHDAGVEVPLPPGALEKALQQGKKLLHNAGVAFVNSVMNGLDVSQQGGFNPDEAASKVRQNNLAAMLRIGA
jgi:hypothetical protein